MSAHIEEFAELYAAGTLDENDRRAVEDHVSACSACAQRLDAARELVADIESVRPQRNPTAHLGQRVRSAASPRKVHAVHWWSAGVAAAAAFAIALIPAWLAVDRTQTLSRAMSGDEAAMAQIASAPSLGRANFVGVGRPMSAKVLYGMAGDWYYVVVRNPKPRMEVAYVHDGSMEPLGTVAIHGNSGSLYLPIRHRMDELALVEGGRVVADAHLVY